MVVVSVLLRPKRSGFLRFSCVETIKIKTAIMSNNYEANESWKLALFAVPGAIACDANGS